MSAVAPLPSPEPEIDLGSELDGLRRRADDQAALLRKHQAAVTQLADSVAALVALGKKRNRWINLNSFVAYVLFTMLLGGAMFVLYRSRVGELEARRAQAVAERDLARAARPAATAADHDDAIAAALYAVVRTGDDAELIAREPEIAAAALTPTERAMLTDAVAAAKRRRAGPSADDGVSPWKAGKWAEAAPALERSIATEPNGPGAAQLRYYLGVARWKLGDHAAAADQLERALGGTLDAAASDARYYFAASLDKLGDLDRARAEYDRFATANPRNQYAVFARRRSAALLRKVHPGAAARKAGAKPEPEPTAPAGRAFDQAVAPAQTSPSPSPAAPVTETAPP